jgi:hypothetical protein
MMTNHDEANRERRPSQVLLPGSEETTAGSSRRPSTRIKPREACLEDFGSDYPTPPPEANGEDF